MFASSKISDVSSAHSWSQVSKMSKASGRLSTGGMSTDVMIGDFVVIEGMSQVALSQVASTHSHKDVAGADVKSISSFGSSTLRDAVSLLSKLEIIEPISTDHPLNKLLRKLSSQMNALKRNQPNFSIKNAMDKWLDKLRLLETLLYFTQKAISYAKRSTVQEVNAELEGFFKEMERFISEAEMTSIASKRIKSKMTKEVLEIKRGLSMGKLAE